jgi:histidinol-phosphate aminotransferase
MERYVPPFADRSVINLSLNEHPAPPSPEVCMALRDVPLERLVTYDTEQAERLRIRLAEREGVRPDNILLCAGSSHALQLLFSCLSDSGAVLFPSICWSYYLSLARLNGLQVSRYELARGASAFQVEPSSVERALEAEDVSLLLFINPHMPTGALTDGDFILACAAQAPGGLVLVDEAYHGFSPEAGSLAPRVLEHENLIVSKTFSKYFGLAGLRVGYLVAHASVVEQLGKALSPFGVPYLSSRLATAALDSESYYRDQARVLMAVQDTFRRRLAALPHVRPYDSHGNFLLVELPGPDEARDAEVRLHAAGVAVRSASGYGLPSFLRISIGTAETMNTLATVLEERHAAR